MTWGDAMKDIKEKPTAHMPRSNATGEIPKAALKKAWAEAKEKSRTMLRESTSTQGDGDYTKPQTFEIDKMSAILHRMCHNAYRYRAGDSRFFRFQTSRLFIPAEAGDAAAVLIGSQQPVSYTHLTLPTIYSV